MNETAKQNDARIERECAQVVDCLKERFPDVTDYGFENDQSNICSIFNARNEVIGTITESELMEIYNRLK